MKDAVSEVCTPPIDYGCAITRRSCLTKVPRPRQTATRAQARRHWPLSGSPSLGSSRLILFCSSPDSGHEEVVAALLSRAMTGHWPSLNTPAAIEFLLCVL